MALDTSFITESILSFYDFSNKDVIHVGAGGGKLIAYSHIARRIKALDNNPVAIELLEKCAKKEGLEHKLFAIEGDFMNFKGHADVVFFEFCLHEMEDAFAAIKHAKNMFADIIILDHSPDSKWAYYALEEKKTSKSWSAIEKFDVKKMTSYSIDQKFESYDYLVEKLSVLGDKSIKRIKYLEGNKDISISMPFYMVQI